MLSRLIAQSQQSIGLDDTIARIGLAIAVHGHGWRLVRTHLCENAADLIKLRIQDLMPNARVTLQMRELNVAGLRGPLKHVALWIHGTQQDAEQARETATSINLGYLRGQIAGC